MEEEEKRICELCGSTRNLERHHLIPKIVVKQRGIEGFENYRIWLCYKCHKALHNSFLEHLYAKKRIDGINRFDAIRYQILQEFLKNKHYEIHKESKNFLREFIRDSFEDFE